MTSHLLLGRYELHRLLGRGGMAEVWQARDTRLGRQVAIKTVNLSSTTDRTVGERLQREAVAIAALKHPDIVTVYDAGVEDDTAYLVMELVEGTDLAAALRDGPLPVPEALRIAERVAGALAAAHAAGIVHRDIKPGNVLVRGDDVTVVDFGIAFVAQAAGASLTEPGTVIGTADYMAPEQAEGGEVSPATDVYALGCLITTLVAGRPPFTAEHPMAILQQHVASAPPHLATLQPDVPPDVGTLVAGMLAKDPAGRPSAELVLGALQDLREHGTTGAVAAAGGATEVLPGGGETRPLPQAAGATAPLAAAPTAPLTQEAPTTTGSPRRRGGWLAAGVLAIVAAVAIAVALLDGDQPAGGDGETSPAAGEETTAPQGPDEEPTEAEGDPPPEAGPPPENGQAQGEGPPEDVGSGGMESLISSLEADQEVREDLLDRWQDVNEAVAEGKADKVADKARDFDKRIDEHVREGRLSQEEADALREELDTETG